MKLLAIIAARGGSKGVKNKNIRLLAGKPLIAYSIEQVQRWGGFTKFIVSTDSPEIADVSRRYGAEVPFLRPPEFATDTAGKMSVLRNALRMAETHYEMTFDAVLDVDATAPVRTVADIEAIVQLFQSKECDCVFSVVKAHRNPYFNMVELQPDGTVKLCKTQPFQVTSRQSAPVVYDMNASLYVYDRAFLLDTRNNSAPAAQKAYAYEMNELSRIDIDSELDILFIEFLVSKGIVSL